jgi:hypothetical protein
MKQVNAFRSGNAAHVARVYELRGMLSLQHTKVNDGTN